jgi:cardiolipin synthase A/B
LDTARLTSAVVVALIAAAVKEILIVSFATQSQPQVSEALPLAAEQAVDITLVLERTQDNPGFFGSPAFPSLTARRLAWSPGNRPLGAALHAKLIVVDARVALVGSANLTGKGLEDNLECGVLIRGGEQPRAIRDYIWSLHHRGELAIADSNGGIRP